MPLSAEAQAVVEAGSLRPERGALRLFDSRLADGFWASSPWLPYVAVGAMSAVLLEHLPRGPEATAWLAGIAGWVVLEYLMHRFFFHLPLRGRRAAEFRLLVHEHHHARPWDRRRIAASWWQMTLALALLAGVERALLPTQWPVALLGSGWAYALYEAVHHRIHHDREGGRVLRALRAHHLRHHHGAAGARRGFGISSPLLDWLLRS